MGTTFALLLLLLLLLCPDSAMLASTLASTNTVPIGPEEFQYLVQHVLCSSLMQQLRLAQSVLF